MKSCAPFRENFSPVHLGRRRGLLGPGGRDSRRSEGDALRGRRAPLLLSASCPQVSSGGGRSGSGWVAESRLWRREGTLKRCPESPGTRVRSRPARCAERDLERRGASSALREPPQERRGGRWAGGRAGMARGDTYTRGGRGGGARRGKPHPRGTRRGRGGRRRLARAGPRLRAGGRVAGEAAGRGRSAPAAAPTRAAPGRREAGGAGRAAGRGVCNAVGSSAGGGAPAGCARSAASCGRARSPRPDGAAGRPAPGAAAEAGKTGAPLLAGPDVEGPSRAADRKFWGAGGGG